MAGSRKTDGTKNRIRAAVEGWTQRYKLTEFEESILADALEGAERPELARRRRLSAQTMKTYIRRLLHKTGDRRLGGAARRLLFDLVFGEGGSAPSE